MMSPGNAAAIALALCLTGATAQLAAQARVGGRGGRSGVRSGGGAIGARPGSLGGRINSGRIPRGSTHRGAIVGSRTTLHPRGYAGASPSSTNTALPQAPAMPASAPAPAPKARVGSGRASRTFVSVPRGRPSIPPLGDSIPPLEGGTHPRARVDPAHVRGFGRVDFGRRRGSLFQHRFPVVFLPYGYGYSDYSRRSERIVIVDDRTSTRSSANVERVPQAPPPEEESTPSADAKIIEIRPREPAANSSGANPQDASSVEVLRGSEFEGGEDEAPLYLIARRDETIVTSQKHWIAGNTVHYITPKGEHRRIPMENLDLDLTARLNRERGLRFVLEVLPGN